MNTMRVGSGFSSLGRKNSTMNLMHLWLRYEFKMLVKKKSLQIGCFTMNLTNIMCTLVMTLFCGYPVEMSRIPKSNLFKFTSLLGQARAAW